MKNCILIVFALGLVFGKSQAQNPEEKRVSMAFDRLVVGMIKADAEEISMVASEDLDYGHSSGIIQNRNEFIQEVVSRNPITYQSIERESESIRISGKTATMRTVLIIRGTSPTGEAINLRLPTLMVWKKEGKAWRLYVRQAFRLPT